MQFLRIQDVVNKVTIKKSEIWERVKDGRFPKPISLSPRVTVWDISEIDEWMKKQKELSRMRKI
jgi:prophage regulatory protein